MEFYEKTTNGFLNILKGVCISIIFTLVCLFVFSCILVYSNLSESLIQPVIIVITGISILLGSSICNRKTTKNGFLNGAFVGGIYMLLIYLLSSISNDINFALNLQSIIMIITGMLAGVIGGIIGVNLK